MTHTRLLLIGTVATLLAAGPAVARPTTDRASRRARKPAPPHPWNWTPTTPT